MTIEEAVKFGIINSEQVDIARKELEKAGLEEQRSFYAFFPSLNLSSQHGVGNSFENPKPNQFLSQMGITLSESLYDNGESFYSRNVGKQNLEVAHLQFKAALNNATQKIVESFLSLLRSEQIFKIKTQDQAALNKQFSFVEGMFKQGLQVRSDYRRFSAQFKRSELALKEAQAQLEKNRIHFLHLLNVDNSVVSTLKTPPVRTDFELYPDTLKNNPVSQSAFTLAQKSILEIEMAHIRRTHFPEINVSTGVFYNNQDYLGENRFSSRADTTWNVLLSVNYKIFDWGNENREVQMKLIDSQLKRQSLDELQRQEKRDFDTFLSEIDLIKERYTLSQELLSLENEAFSSSLTEYKQGKRTSLEIIDTLEKLNLAKTSVVETTSQLLSIYYKSKFFEGTLYETLAKN